MKFNAEYYFTVFFTFTLFIDDKNRSYTTQLKDILKYIKECKQTLNNGRG